MDLPSHLVEAGVVGWELVVACNSVIALCYVAICGLILQGLVRTRQLGSNPLALATAAIFATCAAHHGMHGLHLATSAGDAQSALELQSARALFGSWHSIAVDVLGAAVAATYLALRRNYKALLNTPAMFDDAVRNEAERRMAKIAFTDQLTGIANRAAFQAHADEVRDDEGDLTVLFLDLDGFKIVNDTHGHDAGDRLLHDVAQRLQGAMRDGERVFRLGGDEFLVVGDGDPDELELRVRRLVEAPLDARNGPLRVAASIGSATGPCSSVERLVREADASMYQLKRGGHGRTVVLPGPPEVPALS